MTALARDILAIVPARGGSKGIPRKNLHPFRGRPLIDYTIEALAEVPELEHVLISSEDPEVLGHCAAIGVNSGYQRPDELATDDSPIVESLLDGLEWARTNWQRDFSYLMMLQPTSPLRTSGHIRQFIYELEARRPDSLVAVSPMSEHPMECVMKNDEVSGWQYLVPPPPGSHGRQSYRGSYYFINGALYAATPEFLSAESTFLVPNRTELFEMAAKYSLDIDTPEDLLR